MAAILQRLSIAAGVYSNQLGGQHEQKTNQSKGTVR